MSMRQLLESNLGRWIALYFGSKFMSTGVLFSVSDELIGLKQPSSDEHGDTEVIYYYLTAHVLSFSFGNYATYKARVEGLEAQLSALSASTGEQD